MATPPDIEQPPASPGTEVSRLTRKLERERAIRQEAEAIAEKGLRDLYTRQRELETLERIAGRANEGGSIREVLLYAIREVCGFHDWKVGYAYRVQRRGDKAVLVSADIWTDAADQFRPFQRVTKNSEFGAGYGLPGRALETGLPLWIADLAEDNNFPRLGVALACGLKSACAFPVLSGTQVVAVLEFFDTEAREPSESFLHMLRHAGTQLGRAIERQDATEAMETKNRELARARDEAQDADRAKSAFLAAMSHELRTPLNAIIGFSDLMQQEIFGALAPRYREYAGDIQRSGEHLKNVINNILDLSKVAVGEMTLREAPVSLAAIVETCERIMAPMAATGQVATAYELEPGLPVMQGDETRLQQSLLNLLSNAVKFTPPGGAVRLTAARGAHGRVVITVSDTGIGMSRDEIVIALQPFRQIDSSLSRRYEGTGLGLPLAKAFAELHGGALEIESVPHHGTTARLTLPAWRCLPDVVEALRA